MEQRWTYMHKIIEQSYTKKVALANIDHRGIEEKKIVYRAQCKTNS